MSTTHDAVTGSSRLVVEHLVRFGPQSRTELATHLDLSRASLTRLTKPLVESGLVVEGREEQQSATGRPARLLDIDERGHRFVGINLTGRDATAVVTDLRARVLDTEVAGLQGTGPSSVIESVSALVRCLTESEPNVLGVGISLGGHVVDRRTVVRAPFLGWHEDVALGDLVGAATGLPVLVDNDLLSLTRAERWFGEGRHTDHFALVTVGAGVGFGLVVHDRIVASPDAGVGLLGHHPLDPFGPRCLEGHRGCASVMLTTAGIRAQAIQALGRDVTFAEVLGLARDGHVAAGAILDDAGVALGVLLGAVLNIAMPDTLVLTGEGVDFSEVAADAVREGLRRARDPLADDVSIRTRPHDFQAWSRGAAVAAIEDHIVHRLTASPNPADHSHGARQTNGARSPG